MLPSKTQVIGRIVFDITGHIWLEGFEGRFLIPLVSFCEFTAALASQRVIFGIDDLDGLLASGDLVDENIRHLVCLYKGKAVPTR